MSEQTKNVKFDVSAIKARIKVLEKTIREGKHECKAKLRAFSKNQGPAFFCHPKAYVWKERQEASQLYALRAHMRGKLHIKKEKILNSKGEWVYDHWDLERQADFISAIKDDYLIEETDES